MKKEHRVAFQFRSSAQLAVLSLALGSALSAAPRLTLSPQTAYTVSVAQGSNGSTISVDARNSGDGKLNLQVSSSVPWLSASLGAQRTCGFFQCTPVVIALQTASLAKGMYTGFVTVSDPNAVDAPQTISVTVSVGGAIPDQLTFYLPPGGSASQSFTAGGSPSATASTQSGGNWLAISANGIGSIDFNVPFQVTATAYNGLAAGDYQGSIALSGSKFAPDNKTIPVALHVTTQPISQASSQSLLFTIATGAAKQTIPVAIFNSGQGMLAVSDVKTSTATGGAWLSAQTISGGISVTADPSSLQPGTYTGTVTVTSNAANGTQSIPVTLIVNAQGAPFAFAGGVVNNGNFGAGEQLAQGDIVAVFGDQFTFGDPQSAASLPLPTMLGGTQVFLNNLPAPVYYVSPGQINFQIPYDAAIGDGVLRVDRNGQRGNNVSVNVVRDAPRMLALSGGPYAILTTPDATLTGIPSHPAHALDVIVIYAIGLGPTQPSVVSGAASPADPLARVTPTPQVCFGGSGLFSQMTCVTPQFAGLTPNFVGLYQVNVQLPSNVPKGAMVPMFLLLNDTRSSVVQIDIQ